MTKKIVVILVAALIIVGGIGVYAFSRLNSEYNQAKDNVLDETPKDNVIVENEQDPEDSVVDENYFGIEIGNTAPNFTLENLDGEYVTLEDLRGKTVLINFWATWCPYCVKEMPDLDKLYQENKDDDFIVLAIDVGETKDQATKFVEDGGYKFPVLLDQDGVVSRRYFVQGIPTSYIIDKEGKVRSMKMSMMTYPEMKQMLDSVKE